MSAEYPNFSRFSFSGISVPSAEIHVSGAIFLSRNIACKTGCRTRARRIFFRAAGFALTADFRYERAQEDLRKLSVCGRCQAPLFFRKLRQI